MHVVAADGGDLLERDGEVASLDDEPLQRELELATEGGATAVAERARAELHATGARPRREALRGTGSLTPSERRVADLAAEGRSNRDIAQELFVGPREGPSAKGATRRPGRPYNPRPEWTSARVEQG